MDEQPDVFVQLERIGTKVLDAVSEEDISKHGPLVLVSLLRIAAHIGVSQNYRVVRMLRTFADEIDQAEQCQVKAKFDEALKQVLASMPIEGGLQ